MNIQNNKRSNEGELPLQPQQKIQKIEPPPINTLPSELLMHIFSFLDIEDLLKVSLVNFYCHEMTADNLLWKAIANRIDGLVNKVDVPYREAITTPFKGILKMAGGIGVFIPEHLKKGPKTAAKLEKLIPYHEALDPGSLVECIKHFTQNAPETIVCIIFEYERGYLSTDDHLKLAGYVMSQNIIQVWSKIALAEKIPHEIPNDLHISWDSKHANSLFNEWVEKNMDKLNPIRDLNLSDLNLIYLPDKLQLLTNLKKLNLKDNRLNLLPNWIGNLTKLEILEVTDNFLSRIPDCVKNLQSLTTLNLDLNEFDLVPDPIKYLGNLKNLNLEDNRITVLPDWIGNFSDLEILSLYNNPIEYMPESAAQLKKLKVLDISNTQLTRFPPCIFEMDNLRELSIGACLYPSFSPIPKNKLTKLTDLEIIIKQDDETNIDHSDLRRVNINVTILEN
jgi:Leucine-rich repeat (LRR) protein